jgi:hypothetical protein
MVWHKEVLPEGKHDQGVIEAFTFEGLVGRSP